MRNLILSALLFLFSVLLLVFYDTENEKKSKEKELKTTPATSIETNTQPQNRLVTASR